VTSSYSNIGWFARLWSVVKSRPRDLTLAFGASALGSLGIVSIPIIEQAFVDAIVAHHLRAADRWVIALAVLAVVSFGLALGRRMAAARVALGTQHLLRTQLFSHLQILDFSQHDRLRSGQLVSQANADLSLIQAMLAWVPRLAGLAVLTVLSLVVMAVVYWPLAILVTVALVIATVLSVRFRKAVFPASLVAQALKGEVNEVVEETVRGIAVVKGGAHERAQLDRLHETAHGLYRARVATIWRQAKLSGTLQLFPLGCEALVIGIGGVAAIHGQLTLGSFLLFATYIIELSNPIRQVSGFIALVEEARAGVVRVFDLLETDPKITESPHPVPLSSISQGVSFRGVSCAYGSSAPVVRDFDLELEAGKTVAIVGPSGCGKSSVAMLIPRFYDASAGSVKVDGVDVRELSLSDLRRCVGIVYEDSFLFSDTIAANIALGVPDASREEILAAARAAHADEFISELPEGYDTVVGERGVRLSGGQRQRISLARALITNPSMLILDDATSAIDPLTEAEIYQALKHYGEGRTMLLIAHRRSTLALADRIVVMDEGVIIASGTHEDLVASCPPYVRLLEIMDTEEFDDIDSELSTDAPRESTEVPDDTVSPPSFLDRHVETPVVSGSFRFGDLFRVIRWGIIAGFILVALDAILGLVSPLILRSGIDSGVEHHNAHLVIVAAFVLGILAICDLAVVLVEEVVAGVAAERFLLHLRSRIFQKLLLLGMDYYEGELSGRIMTRMISDVDAFSNLVQEGLTPALVAVLSFGLVLAAVIVLSPDLSLVLIATLPLVVVGAYLFQKYARRAYTLARERIAGVNAHFQEHVSGIRVARALGVGPRASESFEDLSWEYRSARMSAQWAVALYFPFLAFLSDLTIALTLKVGGDLILRRSLAVGTVIAVALYVTEFFTPIQQLSQTFDEFQQARVAATQIKRLMATPVLVTDPVDPLPLEVVAGEITFAKVSFTYPRGTTPALQEIDLVITPGQRVAFVGETGAGKSTVAKLLVRFYDPTQGEILVDGVPIHSVRLLDYRSQIAYLPQEPFLFSGTLARNVAFGSPDVTEHEIRSACDAVGLRRFIETHEGGLEYEVGDRGVRLSAGERQLTILARLMVRDPRIVILDEVSSSLDLIAESQVQAALDHLAKGRTTVTIAHRLASLTKMDRIFVVSHGRIVEEGTHEGLRALGGRYAELWSLSN